MSANYDLVVTSGGIGPTYVSPPPAPCCFETDPGRCSHDDITYPSIAAAFGLPIARHAETAVRMRRFSKLKPGVAPFDWDTPSPTLTARMRMAELPVGPSVKVFYVSEVHWVPICVVNYNIHILPGVPTIFETLLGGLRAVFEEEKRVDSSRRLVRVLISTSTSESEVALFLTELQDRVKSRGVKVGSYPR